MAEKKSETFTVTDKRLFTAEGELRKDAPEEQETPAGSKPVSESKPVPEAKPVQESQPASVSETSQPQGPTAAEQQQQADAYRESSAEMDREVELGGRSAKDLEITFERFLASIYMSGMLQLGLMHEQ